jgi:nitrogen regulatory protein PII
MISETVHMTENYVSRLFKSESGMNVVGYINMEKMEQARRLLSRPESTVRMAAGELGYYESSYFIKLFRKTLAYLNNGEQQPARYTPELNGKYELIVIVANEGRTDQVMNAARAAGATGGTVLHGKGTGSQNPKKFYNVSIASEKEVILMVAQNDRKAAIMQSVLHHAGPDSEAGAILFSLPVSEVAGFGLMEDSIT